jgi:D-alanyl-lipoteichoic acid acyltransferase DltB (MBOAT superfamily)
MIEAWTGLLAYTVQIYFDFAGYSNMAIGLGLILGFTLPRNFRFPYTALSITEFWRRWHMSLSSWLRDYLYIPLGGSRGGALRTYRNLVIVFLLYGLWHGASWTFVFWGAWHGAFLVLERIGLSRLLYASVPMRWACAQFAVMGGWVLFRSRDLSAAKVMYGSLIGQHSIGAMSFDFHLALPLGAGCVLAVLPRGVKLLSPGRRMMVVVADSVWTFSLLLVAMVYVAAGVYSPFLYFRF